MSTKAVGQSHLFAGSQGRLPWRGVLLYGASLKVFPTRRPPGLSIPFWHRTGLERLTSRHNFGSQRRVTWHSEPRQIGEVIVLTDFAEPWTILAALISDFRFA